MNVLRTLPQRGLPTVGAWCFLDSFGPDRVAMSVLPHPHTGLQTVTWPLAGNIRHRDSVGSDVIVRPGELNIMTAGRGVSHSEFAVLPHQQHQHKISTTADRSFRCSAAFSCGSPCRTENATGPRHSSSTATCRKLPEPASPPRSWWEASPERRHRPPCTRRLSEQTSAAAAPSRCLLTRSLSMRCWCSTAGLPSTARTFRRVRWATSVRAANCSNWTHFLTHASSCSAGNRSRRSS